MASALVPLVAMMLTSLSLGAETDGAVGGEVIRREHEPRTRKPVRVANPGACPLPFEANHGQTDPSVRYLARGRGFVLHLTDDDAVFATRDGSAVRMRVAGASRRCPPRGQDRLKGVSNYIIGQQASRWLAGVPHFRTVLQRDVQVGTSLRWRGDRGAIEYEVELEPGAPMRVVGFEIEGARGVRVAQDGSLEIDTPGGRLRHSEPIAFQPGAEGPLRVLARFVVREPGCFEVVVGPCEAGLPVVIDPRVEFATYFGGDGVDSITCVTMDGSANIYFAGATTSSDFPTQDAYQGTRANPQGDAFVSKFDPSGSTLLYSTYLGGIGTDSESVRGIAVDSEGAAYVAGETHSTDFPTVSPIHGNKLFADAFLAKLHPSGSSLVYSTYIGGDASTDFATDVAVDSTGAAYVTGYTRSTDFPTQSPYQSSNGGVEAAFVCKVNAQGSAFVFSTYLGGSASDRGARVCVDANGGCVVLGSATSSNFPVLSALQATKSGFSDLFITRFSVAGTSLVYSTYFGGPGDENPGDLALDSNGAPYLTGSTSSTTLATAGAFQGTHGGGAADLDAFAAKLSADGATRSFFTYLGGSAFDRGVAVAVDSSGRVWVAGTTESANFPTVDPILGSLGGSRDAFVTRLAPDAGSAVYSTYFGGGGVEDVGGLALDGTAFVLAGVTTSSDLPTVTSYQTGPASSTDSFLLRASTSPHPAPSGLSNSLASATSIQLDWTDNSANETGFEVQRKIGSGVFNALVTLPADSEAHLDAGVASGTNFAYRVRGVNEDGVSPWSAETFRSTPPAIPGVPLTPSALSASTMSVMAIALEWADESDNENFFQVQRRTGTGPWEVLSTPSPNAESYSDTQVLPDRTYSYRIRAGNNTGFSDFSEMDSATTPATIETDLVKGLLRDSLIVGRDVVTLRGTLVLTGASPDSTYDPTLDGFEVRLGGSDGTTLITLPGGVEGWILRRGRHIWRSPKGSISKAKVVVDPAVGTWSLSIRRTTLPPIPSNPIGISLTVGNDAGTSTADWTPHPRKAGVLRFP